MHIVGSYEYFFLNGYEIFHRGKELDGERHNSVNL